MRRNTITRKKISYLEFPFNFIKDTYDISDDDMEKYMTTYFSDNSDVFATFMYYYNYCLTDRIQRIVEKRFEKGMTYKEIGESEEISQSRVTQILFEAGRKMREAVKFYDLQRGLKEINKEKDREITRLKAIEVMYSRTKNPLLEKSLYDFASFVNLSPRASSCLYKLGVKKIEDIMKITKKDLLDSLNCGIKTADEIEYAMLSIGLALKKEIKQ